MDARTTELRGGFARIERFFQGLAITHSTGGPRSTARCGLAGRASYGDEPESHTATGTTIKGDYIGLALNNTACGNGNDGVYAEVNTSGTTVGGAGANDGNVISCNGFQAGSDGFGVCISGDNSLVQNNIIGLDRAGIANAIFKNKGGWQSNPGTGNVWLNNQHD